MIAKISNGNSVYGALAYNQDKVDEGQGRVLGANIINQPLDGRFCIHDCLKDFENWLPSHYRTKNAVMHVSLNPHPDDRLTDQQLVDIGEEYMRKMGYGAQPYIIFKHEDIDRHHIHIVSLRVNSIGKKIDDSYEYRRSKEITQQIEQEYRLHPAEGTGNPQEKWEFSPVDTAKGNLKHQISNVLIPIMDMYKFRTIGEYRALLSLYNITVEEVRGHAKGKDYIGLVYSALDEEGKKYGPPLKSSLFGKKPGYTSLTSQMQDHASLFKSPAGKRKIAGYRSIIADAMNNAANENEFRQQLHSSHMDIIFRRNDSGRIYGVTFIDHENRLVLNGSQLGKEYSANTFNDWQLNDIRPEIADLSHPDANEPFLTAGKQSDAGYTHSRTDWENIADRSEYEFSNDNWEHHSSAEGDAISLFGPVSGGAATDEPMPRKKRKKKKRKPGQQQ